MSQNQSSRSNCLPFFQIDYIIKQILKNSTLKKCIPQRVKKDYIVWGVFSVFFFFIFNNYSKVQVTFDFKIVIFSHLLNYFYFISNTHNTVLHVMEVYLCKNPKNLYRKDINI